MMAGCSMQFIPFNKVKTSTCLKKTRILPGFRFSMGCTLFYLCLIVLIPISFTFVHSFGLGGAEFLSAAAAPRVMAAYRISFGCALAAAGINGIFGCLTAWVLVRYSFPGRRILDALVDLPFALPTAVAGIALTAVYSQNGWVGQWLAKSGLQIAFTPIGIVVALIFVGLPFVVRTIQPVLEDVDAELEEAAASLGASGMQSFVRVVFPTILPALLTGIALAFARAVGEYGSVVFISGNMPMRTEIAPLLIVTKLEQYDTAGATAIAVVLLVVSFILLLAINGLQAWSAGRMR